MLVGRESERADISRAMAGARVGESGVLVLTGEAGIGKTALLDWAATTAGQMQVLRATGVEAEQEIPFAGLLQLLRPLLELIDELPGPQADALATAFALRPPATGDRFAVGAGTLSLLCLAAQRRPLALLVDDGQLLDRPSADALVFAARRLLADPVLLLVGVRSGEPSAFVEAGLPALAIGALDRPAAAGLLATRVAGVVPDTVLDRLYRATGGNPLALLELSNDLERLQSLPPDAPVPVPDTVARAVAREIEGLDAPARLAALVAAASSGELSAVSAAIGLLGIDPDALRRVERANLLSIAGGRVVFRHPLVRSSVYGAADPGDRRAVHRVLFDALGEQDLERRAWHLAASVSGYDEPAADLLDEAARRASSRNADAVAAAAYERAAELSTDIGGLTRRLVLAGESAWLAGQPDRSRLLLDTALRLATTAAQRVRAQEVLGAVAARSGSLLVARDTLARAADEAERFDTDQAVVLLADALNACLYLGDSAWAWQTIDRLERQLAAGVGLRALILGSMALGIARVLAGRGGVAEIRRSVNLLTGSDILDDDPRRVSLLVLGPLFLRESDTGRDLIDRVVQESRSRAAIGSLPTLLFHLARDDATTDQWSNATLAYHESIRLARETGQSTELASSLAGLGWLEARQGLRAECEEHLHEAAELCDTHRIHLFSGWCLFGRGDLESGRGSLEVAVSRFSALQTHLTAFGIGDVDLAPGPELVDLLMRLNRVDEATRIAADYHRRASSKGQPWALARAERCLAVCTADDDVSDRAFAAALAWHDATLDDFERGKTLLAQGSRLRRRRRRVAARQPLRAALGIFDALGAVPSAELAAIELRATGETSQPRGASILTRLTAQERQIAGMLAGGMSTKQTASALFLSPKTVEYHLRHVYTKLDVHTRQDLARIMSD